MNNNYEYVQSLKKNKEEQEKIKKQLQKTLDILLIPEEEKEQLLSSVIDNAINSYTQNTLFPFLRYVKIKLKKEIEKKYFTPSQLISIEEQKIINLYLSKKDEHFLTEEEIRERLQINSGTLYQTITKLENTDSKTKRELLKLFPNYKQQLKERKKYFHQPIELSETDLRYLGYYIGEIDDICLDIHDIAVKEGKKETEIEKSLKSIFNLLKSQKNLQLVKEKYPNCEKMLEIKAANLGIRLQKKESIPKPKAKRKKEIIPTKTVQAAKPEKPKTRKKSTLTEKQEILLKELAKNPSMERAKLAKITGYKNAASVGQILILLKKRCKNNQQVKEKVLELCPTLLTPKRRSPNSNEKRTSLTEEERKFLRALNNSEKTLPTLQKINTCIPCPSKREIDRKVIAIKNDCQQSEEIKQEVLELFPDFFERTEFVSTFSDQQQKLLLALKKHYNQPITKQELAKELNYKNEASITILWKRIKKLVEENETAKKEALTIHPDFLEHEIKFPRIKREPQNTLTKMQEDLLKTLNETASAPLTEKELAEKTGYASAKTVSTTIGALKKKCQKNQEFKEIVLSIYPEFLTSKNNSSLTDKELQLLQNIYLITPPQTTYSNQEQLANQIQCSQSQISHIKTKALEKIDSNEKVKKELQKSWPTFEQDRALRENYRKTQSIKIPSEDLEGIKSFIRQFDIPENEIKTEETKNPILTGIKNLEESIFSPYVSKCTEEQKAMLALRLGYINAPARTETVAQLFNVEEQEVITLTKNCLKSVKIPTDTKRTAKVYEKKELRQS